MADHPKKNCLLTSRLCDNISWIRSSIIEANRPSVPKGDEDSKPRFNDSLVRGVQSGWERRQTILREWTWKLKLPLQFRPWLVVFEGESGFDFEWLWTYIERVGHQGSRRHYIGLSPSIFWISHIIREACRFTIYKMDADLYAFVRCSFFCPLPSLLPLSSPFGKYYTLTLSNQTKIYEWSFSPLSYCIDLS